MLQTVPLLQNIYLIAVLTVVGTNCQLDASKNLSRLLVQETDLGGQCEEP